MVNASDVVSRAGSVTLLTPGSKCIEDIKLKLASFREQQWDYASANFC